MIGELRLWPQKGAAGWYSDSYPQTHELVGQNRHHGVGAKMTHCHKAAFPMATSKFKAVASLPAGKEDESDSAEVGVLVSQRSTSE